MDEDQKGYCFQPQRGILGVKIDSLAKGRKARMKKSVAIRGEASETKADRGRNGIEGEVRGKMESTN